MKINEKQLVKVIKDEFKKPSCGNRIGLEKNSEYTFLMTDNRFIVEIPANLINSFGRDIFPVIPAQIGEGLWYRKEYSEPLPVNNQCISNLWKQIGENQEGEFLNDTTLFTKYTHGKYAYNAQIFNGSDFFVSIRADLVDIFTGEYKLHGSNDRNPVTVVESGLMVGVIMPVNNKELYECLQEVTEVVNRIEETEKKTAAA